MKLTTPYAVLAGFALVALAIASQPFTGLLVPEAWAQSDRPVKVVLCNEYGFECYDPFNALEVTVGSFPLRVAVCSAFPGDDCAAVDDGYLLTSDMDDYR